MARKIEVVDYCPEWKEKFWQEAAKIQEILGENCITVYHIGSTSVKGLRAKPIIDLMPVVKELEAVDLHNKEFEALGYECKGEYGILGRRFFMKGGDLRTHHVHIFAEESRKEIERHLAVRDYLRTHKKDAEAYAALKTELAEKFTYDNEGYCDGKDSFVKDLERKALEWRKIIQCVVKSLALAMGSVKNLRRGIMFIGKHDISPFFDFFSTLLARHHRFF